MTEPLTIAYVAPDEADAHTIKGMLGKWLVNPIEIYKTGDLLLTRLHQHVAGLTMKPGIVLVDLRHMDVINKIRADHGDMVHVPKIIVTGDDTEDAVESARHAGADAYIVKPIKIHALMMTLNQVAPYMLQIIEPANRERTLNDTRARTQAV